jgi:excisionase family DNA binding protein
MAKKKELPVYVSLDEAAEMMSLSTCTIRRRISDGTIPAYQCGRRPIRIRPTSSKPRYAASPPRAGELTIVDRTASSAAIIEHARAAEQALRHLCLATVARPSIRPVEVDVVLAHVAAAIAAVPQAASQLSDVLERAKDRYVLGPTTCSSPGPWRHAQRHSTGPSRGGADVCGLGGRSTGGDHSQVKDPGPVPRADSAALTVRGPSAAQGVSVVATHRLAPGRAHDLVASANFPTPDALKEPPVFASLGKAERVRHAAQIDADSIGPEAPGSAELRAQTMLHHLHRLVAQIAGPGASRAITVADRFRDERTAGALPRLVNAEDRPKRYLYSAHAHILTSRKSIQ